MPQPADHTRLITHAHLPHVHAHVKMRGQIAHERTEVHTRVCGEVEGGALTIEEEVHGGRLHVQLVLIGQVVKHRHRVARLLLQLLGAGEILLGRQPVDGFERIGDEVGRHIHGFRDDEAHVPTALRGDQHMVALVYVYARRIEPIVFGRIAKAHNGHHRHKALLISNSIASQASCGVTL